VADKEDKKTPGFDPKPVQVGGESILDRLIPHMKKIVVAIVITSIVLGIIFFVIWLQDRKHAKETDKLAQVVDVAARPVLAPGEKADPKDKDQPFADAKERANAVLDTMSTQATDLAGPSYKGAMLLRAGKTDEAIAEYKKDENKPGMDGVLAREGLAIALETKAEAEKDPAARQKGLEDALAEFQKMQPDEKGARHEYALYHQGRVLDELGKRADAKAALQKAKAAITPGSPLAELVDMRLAAIGA
jgi:predicted negative regulator of RcsB-dependent stress response